MIRRLCDVCRVRLDSSAVTLKVKTGSLRAVTEEVHLCETHGDEFALWLATKQPKPTPNVPPGPRTRRTTAGTAPNWRNPKPNGRPTRRAK